MTQLSPLGLRSATSGGGPVVLTRTSSAKLRPATGNEITAGFWRNRQDVNGSIAIIEAYDRLNEAGNLSNLRIAAGLEAGEVRGPVFMDSDIYKWLEAVAWEYGRQPSEQLLELQREVTGLVAIAQTPDGYLDSVVQVRDSGHRYGHLIRSHELYCAGHLFQAAVAQARQTPDTALLDVAVKVADHLVRTFGEGEGKIVAIDGHPIIEMALVELYRETGTQEYLDLASFFVEARGHGILDTAREDPTYFSDRLPVREAKSFEGHAVRAVYFAAGVADVALETGDSTLWEALQRQFATTWERKTYVTGGQGARWEGEAFGDEFELPSDRAYAETCAAIGGIQLSWRLLLGTADSTYADAIEHLLYNAFLPGVSLSGDEYFYVNALQVRRGAEADNERSPAHGRRAWFDVACCPPNIMRTFASLGSYIATSDSEGMQLHQFVSGRFGGSLAGGQVGVSVETEYPHDGAICVTIDESLAEAWTLSIRVPGWAESATASVTSAGAGNDTEYSSGPGYLTITREWSVGDTVQMQIPFATRVLRADSRIDALRESVAIQRGPLVYCAEEVDSNAIDDAIVDAADEIRSTWEPNLLGGVNVLDVNGVVAPENVQQRGQLPYFETGAGERGAGEPAADGVPTTLRLIPYYSWGNRGIGPMRVWLRA